MARVKATKENLFTARELDNEQEFPMFSSEKQRLRYMKEKYGKFDISKAFSLYYNENIKSNSKEARNNFNVVTLELGKIVTAQIKSWNDDGTIEFYIPGVKEEIVTNERFSHDNNHFQQYCTNHNGELSIEVREFKRGRWIVSVMNAYYLLWKQSIEKAIKQENGISVHINSLTRGGFLCSTPIWTLQELTGDEYTSTCFIPGSQIIMSIETDFDKWVGQDVVCVPQKFGTFRQASGAPIEDSIVCSRKRCLQKIGIQNLYQMYQMEKLKGTLSTSTDSVTYKAKVTGVINSNSKTGVFVEIVDKYVIGMLPVSSDELLDFTPGLELNVKIKEFETTEEQESFIVKNDRIIKCNTKPIFELA